MDDAKNKKAQRLRELALAAMDEAAKLESLPSEDFFDDGDVIWFQRKFAPAGQLYTYAAVKIEDAGQWVTTSVRGSNYTTWDQLCELFVSWAVTELWYADRWVEVELP